MLYNSMMRDLIYLAAVVIIISLMTVVLAGCSTITDNVNGISANNQADRRIHISTTVYRF